MESPKRIVILGSSGTSLDILDTLRAINEAAGQEKFRCIGLLDDNPSLKGSTRNGVEVLGPMSMARSLDCYVINGVGSSRSFIHKEINHKQSTSLPRVWDKDKNSRRSWGLRDRAKRSRWRMSLPG